MTRRLAALAAALALAARPAAWSRSPTGSSC
jgi:hypothetical protein